VDWFLAAGIVFEELSLGGWWGMAKPAAIQQREANWEPPWCGHLGQCRCWEGACGASFLGTLHHLCASSGGHLVGFQTPVKCDL
jgi:hypothetical protein